MLSSLPSPSTDIKKNTQASATKSFSHAATAGSLIDSMARDKTPQSLPLKKLPSSDFISSKQLSPSSLKKSQLTPSDRQDTPSSSLIGVVGLGCFLVGNLPLGVLMGLENNHQSQSLYLAVTLAITLVVGKFVGMSVRVAWIVALVIAFVVAFVMALIMGGSVVITFAMAWNLTVSTIWAGVDDDTDALVVGALPLWFVVIPCLQFGLGLMLISTCVKIFMHFVGY